MNASVAIDWDFEKQRFTDVAYPFARRAAQRAFKRWPERKRDDAQGEYLAKLWDSWMRAAGAGS